MWYVRGKVRGIALFAIALGVFALLSGDFGEITWYFIIGGIALWVIGGAIFKDPPRRTAAEEYLKSAERRWETASGQDPSRSESTNRSGDQERLPAVATPSGADSAAGLATPPARDPKVSAEVATDVRNLADSIAEDLEGEWRQAHPQGDEYQVIPYERVREVTAKATSIDKRFDAGDKALLSMLVSAKLRSRGYRVG